MSGRHFALLGAFALAATLMLTACTREAEPRWLIRALPGEYPDVVYFVPTSAQAIALTVDDGLDAETTPRILEVLKAHGAHATFFVLSNSIDGNEALMQQILEEGHEVGHHMTEDEVTVSLEREVLIEKFERATQALAPYGPIQWFRPGSGRYNDLVLELVQTHGYRIALASVAPLDTAIRDAERMAGFVDWMIEPGSIVVLHDAGERGLRTIETLQLLLPRLEERGFSVVSLAELDALADPQPDRS